MLQPPRAAPAGLWPPVCSRGAAVDKMYCAGSGPAGAL